LPQVEGAYKPRAGARTPMQWNSEKNFGFSTAESAQLYLPMDSAPDAPTVAAQQNEPQSLLTRIRKLIEIRKSEPALAAYAEFLPVFAQENAYPFVFLRAVGKQMILAIFNPANRNETAEFKLNVPAKNFERLAGNAIKISRNKQTYILESPGVSYAIYKLK
jgi:glycosidase